jgi:hypothetical protein
VFPENRPIPCVEGLKFPTAQSQAWNPATHRIFVSPPRASFKDVCLMSKAIEAFPIILILYSRTRSLLPRTRTNMVGELPSTLVGLKLNPTIFNTAVGACGFL